MTQYRAYSKNSCFYKFNYKFIKGKTQNQHFCEKPYMYGLSKIFAPMACLRFSLLWLVFDRCPYGLSLNIDLGKYWSNFKTKSVRKSYVPSRGVCALRISLKGYLFLMRARQAHRFKPRHCAHAYFLPTLELLT